MQTNLAKAYAGFEFLRLMNWKVAWQAEAGTLSVADASTTKVFGTEHYLDAISLLLEIAGRARLPQGATPRAPLLRSRLETMYRGLTILTFGGGDERDPARPDRRVRPRHADGQASRPRHRADGDTPWTSHVTDEQVAIADLAGAAPRRARHARAAARASRTTPPGPAPIRELWAALAEANLLGVTVPEDQGGSGLGLVEACELLEQAGRTVAPVPLLATVAYAVPVLAQHGTPEQQAAWLPGVVARRRGAHRGARRGARRPAAPGHDRQPPTATVG